MLAKMNFETVFRFLKEAVLDGDADYLTGTEFEDCGWKAVIDRDGVVWLVGMLSQIERWFYVGIGW